MNARDLRIGNIVESIFGGEIIIGYISRQEVKDGYYEAAGESAQDSFIMKHLTPIPLTEEWLLKFGFEKEIGKLKRFNRVMSSPPLDVVGDFYVRSDNALYFEVVNGEFEFRIWNGTLCKIKYVHQLQNLYFALTGEELTINQQG